MEKWNMNVFKTLTSFFKELSNYVTFDYIVYGAVGLLVLVMIIAINTVCRK